MYNFLIKQFKDIKAKGSKELFKKIKIFFYFTLIFPFYFFTIPLAAPFIILIRIIKPLVHIRFRKIFTSELGHFVDDAGILLCESVLCNQNIKDWYWLPKPTSNRQFEKMVKRTFYVRWWVKYLYIANNIIPGGEKYTTLPPRVTQKSRDIKGLLYKTKEIKKAYFNFLEKEQNYAKKYLQDIGLKEKDKFICLNVRDSSYKNHLHPDRKWNYHNYRDSDISTYEQAAKALAEKGYWVFRTGKVVSKPFNCNHKKVIDYATSKKKSDLLDIWLMANCSFCVTTGSGLDSVPLIYRKPILFINFLPADQIVAYAQTLTYFKHLRWRNKNRELNFKEYLDNTYYHDTKYDSNGIDIKDLTAREIKDAVIEMEKRVNGSWIDKTEDVKLQDKFWNILKKCDYFIGKSWFIHPEAKVSSVFLHSNSNVKQFLSL